MNGDSSFPPNVQMHVIEEKISSVSTERPRLFATAQDFEFIRQRITDEPTMSWLAKELIRAADSLEEESPITRTLQGRRLLYQARRALERISVLAMAWHLKGNESYLRRAEQEMLAIAAFEDWNPSHFLDVAEMTLAMAIGYDWIYNDLSDESIQSVSGRPKACTFFITLESFSST